MSFDDVTAERLARRWWVELKDVAYTPFPSAEIRAMLQHLLRELGEVLVADTFDAPRACAVGLELVSMNLLDPSVLQRSAPILTELPGLLERNDPAMWERLALTVAAVGSGFGSAAAARIRYGMEAMHRTMVQIRQAAHEARRVADARFRVLFESAPIAIAVVDHAGQMVETNPALAAMLGCPDGADLRGTPAGDYLHPDDRHLLVPAADGSVIRSEVRFRRGDGSYGWMSALTTLLPGTDPSGGRVLAVGEDITEQRRMRERLYTQSRHDALTGLANRLLLTETMNQAIADALPGSMLGVCLLDLDEFKAINDHYGHRFGDEVLRVTAGRLRDTASARGYLVARLGGDEFVVVLPDPCTADDVHACAGDLAAAVRPPIDIDGHRVAVSTSIGAIVTELVGVDPDAIIARADTYLYRAKAQAREKPVLHTDSTPYRRRSLPTTPTTITGPVSARPALQHRAELPRDL
ncbi:sensor domain-containing diguanylate cyclase [Skermania piniformis]|uniref:Sensor domain-containing diguanylate cyclase n=1 Tax=Skermania pinensis TaxID=39122 RepID=A0ABX8S8C6_9ACTN|nr:sensor domain-containing diguanylate cyclase [Skermania piniformis]QXQ14095.1 sensor domain-containing diguanylate cyclase [Skermania piniformis]